MTSQGQTQNENLPSVSTGMYVDQEKGSVLLQTATAEVIPPDNDSYSRSVCLVVDSHMDNHMRGYVCVKWSK